MKLYILGNKVIETTEERYNNEFKSMGYVPYEETKNKSEKTKKSKKK